MGEQRQNSSATANKSARPTLPASTRALFAILIALVLLVMALANAPGTAPRVEPVWDALMGAGYAALALMAWLPLLSARHAQNLGLDNAAIRGFGGIHKTFAWTASVLVLVHIIGLLWIDEVNFEYLKPGAPAGMLAAIVASVLFLMLMVSSLKRFSWYRRQTAWRFDHALMSLIALGLCGWHAFDADYYPRSKLFTVPLLIVVFAPTLVSLVLDARGKKPNHAGRGQQTTPRLDREHLQSATSHLLITLLVLLALAIVLFTLPWPIPETDA